LIGEIIFNAIGATVDFFAIGSIDKGLRRFFWLRVAVLAVLAIATGLAAGSLLRALI
jgi:hypothetical protein